MSAHAIVRDIAKIAGAAAYRLEIRLVTNGLIRGEVISDGPHFLKLKHAEGDVYIPYTAIVHVRPIWL